MSIKHRAFLLLALAAVALNCADIPTGPPTGVPDPRPLVSLTDTLDIEFADTASARIRIASGSPQRLFVRALDAGANDSLDVRVRVAGSDLELGAVVALGASTNPRAHTIWLPAQPTTGEADLQLRWIRRTGAARAVMTVARPDVRTEHAKDTLVAGDSVREFTDGFADTDRFFVVGPTGQRVSVFVRHEASSVPVRMQMQVLTVAGATIATRETPISRVSDTLLAVTHTFTGTPIQVVMSAHDIGFGVPAAQAYFESRYRVHVRAVDTLPETGSNVITAGDTVSGYVDGFGDVDRFVLPVAIDEEFRVFLAVDSASSSPVYVQLNNTNVAQAANAVPSDSVLDIVRTNFVWRSGAQPVTIDVYGQTESFSEQGRVPYRILVQRRFREPETSAGVMALGDSLSTETLSSCADADEFKFSAVAGTDFMPTALVNPVADCTVRMRLFAPNGSLVRNRNVPQSGDRDGRRWDAVRLTQTGTYTLRIEGVEQFLSPISRATNIPYSFDLIRQNRQPEIADSAVAPGDSVVTETLERCGDLDEFFVTGTPGTWVMMGASALETTGCQLVLQSSNVDIPLTVGTDRDSTRVSYVPIPAQGYITARVFAEPTGGSVADRGAAYVFESHVVDWSPELAPDAVTLGDTLFETINRCGDRDSFTFVPQIGREYRLVFERARISQCSVFVQVVRNNEIVASTALTKTTPLGPVALTFGSWDALPVRVDINTSHLGATADRDLPYSFRIVENTNEQTSTSLAVGDTSGVELIDAADDTDFFFVPVVAGKEYVIATFGGIAAAYSSAFGGNVHVNWEHPRGHYLPFFAPPGGFIRIRATDGGGTPPFGYRVTVQELNRAPEIADSILEVGDTTAVEALDFPGDVDMYRLVLPAATALRVHHIVDSAYLGYPYLESIGDPQFGIGRGASELIVVPTARSLGLMAWSDMADPDTTKVPTYRVALVQYATANETAPAALTLGTPVTTETMASALDVDMFTATLTSGVTYYVQFVAAPACSDPLYEGALVVHAYRPNDAMIDGASADTDLGPKFSFVPTSTGTHRFRVYAADANAGACVARGYQLRVSTSPAP